MIIKEVGDKIWVMDVGRKETKKTCPVCFGNLNVTVILGDDTEVVCKCQYCVQGFGEPRGYVTEYIWKEAAKQEVITNVRVENDSNGMKVEYRAGCYVYYSDTVFETEEDALSACKIRSKGLKNQEDERNIRMQKSNIKNYSYQAGRHIKAANDSLRQAEYHKKLAAICKSRSRNKLDKEEE